MSNTRLTHPVRPTLSFEQVQQDRDPISVTASIAAAPGDGRPPLVHVTGREREKTVSGRVTSPRQVRDTSATDWEQALANYAYTLEQHVDEFQGAEDAYTFEDDLRDIALPCILTSVEWTYNGGEPYDLLFDATAQVGRGTFGSEDITIDPPSVNTGMDVIATVGGEPLPGFRQIRMTREIETEVTSTLGRDTAEANQITPPEGGGGGVEQRWQIGGTHTGSVEDRRAADDRIRDLAQGQRIDLVTRFPGYTRTGKILNYESNFQADFGARQHRYEVTFIEARDA